MRTVITAGAFIGALAFGRQYAAVYAHEVGMGGVYQLLLALAYSTLLVVVVWLAWNWVKRKVLSHFTFTITVLRKLKGAACKLVPQKNKSDKSSCHAEKPFWRIGLVLIGLAHAPNGFWLNVAILRHRGTSVGWAVLWLAPLNAISLFSYFLMVGLIAAAGLSWLINFVAIVVLVLVILLACLIAIDIMRNFLFFIRNLRKACINLSNGCKHLWRQLRPV